MKWVLHPSLLLFIAVALAVAAGVLMYLTPTVEARAEPQPVQPGDQEIVFLYQATSPTWERFVSAVRRLQRRGIIVDASQAFPQQSTAVPELAFSPPSGKGRLVCRWYKLTSAQKVGDWVEALLRRSPPPLAIIGGNTSDAAWELASALARATHLVPPEQLPLLLLTTATAEHVKRPEAAASDASDAGNASVALTQIYAGRTFRFCFTNRQMAEAVTHFLWTTDALRPDPEPIYTVSYDDDAYSKDLTDKFGMALIQASRWRAEIRSAAAQWGWLAAASATGTVPLDSPALADLHLEKTDVLVQPQNIPSSVGMFDQPSEMEARAADWLIEDFQKQQKGREQRRPLLVLAGQSTPSRRFLRALHLTWPVNSRSFVVATGDTLAFNTIYRDRNVTWPIQDLPFSLVFFCHRNPIDAEAGFQPDTPGTPRKPSAISGTEDKLLFEDIAAALLRAAYQSDALTSNASEVGNRLRQVRLAEIAGPGEADVPLFDDAGNRRVGTGEHIVWLQPAFAGQRVLPEATITVWYRQPESAAGDRWNLRGGALTVSYEGASGGNSHAGD
jgi:hypothetical protein